MFAMRRIFPPSPPRVIAIYQTIDLAQKTALPNGVVRIFSSQNYYFETIKILRLISLTVAFLFFPAARD